MGCSRAPLISQAHYLAGNRVTKTNCTVAKGEEARAGGDSPSSCGDTPDRAGQRRGFAFRSHVFGILGRHEGPLNHPTGGCRAWAGARTGAERGFRAGSSPRGTWQQRLRHCEMRRGVRHNDPLKGSCRHPPELGARLVSCRS